MLPVSASLPNSFVSYSLGEKIEMSLVSVSLAIEFASMASACRDFVLSPPVFLGGIGVFVVSRLIVFVGDAPILAADAIVVAWRGGVIVWQCRYEPICWEFLRLAIISTSSVCVFWPSVSGGG